MLHKIFLDGELLYCNQVLKNVKYRKSAKILRVRELTLDGIKSEMNTGQGGGFPKAISLAATVKPTFRQPRSYVKEVSLTLRT